MEIDMKSKKNYILLSDTDTSKNGKTVSVVITREGSIATSVAKQYDFNVIVFFVKNEDLSTGPVYFNISGVETVGNRAFFQLKNVNGEIICSGTKATACEAESTINAYAATFEILQPGWLSNSILSTTTLTRLNSLQTYVITV